MLFWKAIAGLIERIKALTAEARRNGWDDDAEDEAIELHGELALLASAI